MFIILLFYNSAQPRKILVLSKDLSKVFFESHCVVSLVWRVCHEETVAADLAVALEAIEIVEKVVKMTY